jgi:hypothetical protein
MGPTQKCKFCGCRTIRLGANCARSQKRAVFFAKRCCKVSQNMTYDTPNDVS